MQAGSGRPAAQRARRFALTTAEGGMALILPSEARDNAAVWGWLQEMVAGNGPIRQILRKQQNAKVLLAEVVGVDAAAREIAEHGTFGYADRILTTPDIEPFFKG